MSDLGLQLPLRVEALDESVKVLDADGRCVACAYTCPDPERRLQTKRLSPADGIEAATVIARALTVELERREAGVAGDPDALLRAVTEARERCCRVLRLPRSGNCQLVLPYDWRGR